MMSQRFYLSTWLLCFLPSSLFGLSIGFEGSSLPFTVTYDQAVQSSFVPVLQVVNETDASVMVLSWQLELEIRPLPGSQGELLFHRVAAPPNSLFGQDPGPISDLMDPSNSILAFDADTMDFDGEPVPEHMARNILELTLVATSDAAGPFQLVMPEFDPGNPDTSPSWFEADGVEPVAFENSVASAFVGFVLLGTINVTRPFLAGDYDSDGVVGPLDYERWRLHFTNQVSTPGEDADGNRDLIIDAADYVIWRKNMDMQNEGANATVSPAAPEPTSLSLFLIGISACLRCKDCRSRHQNRYHQMRADHVTSYM
jgi:hypothetical protein